MKLLDVMLLVAAGVVAVPVAVIALETIAALWVHRPRRGMPGREPAEAARGVVAERASQARVAVVVPAHDEEGVIGRTLAAIRGQLRAGDRLVVVADNCTDATAAVAREAGAEVVQRRDEQHRGKGYALAAGVDHLRRLAGGPPDVVVLADADTILEAGSMGALVDAVSRRQGPAQGVYLMEVPLGASMRTRLSAFGFAYKNLVRALGAEALGVPCMLRGTGMAFPWPAIGGAAGRGLAGGQLTEDFQLCVDLAVSGFVPRLCRAAQVTGVLPEKAAVCKVQRKRWEQGHMQTIAHNVPRLLWEGLRQRRLALWALALDLAVPPLALVVLAWCALTALAAAALWGGIASPAPLVALLIIGGVMAASILAAWAGFARQLLPLRALLIVPFYVLWKIPFYVGILVKRERSWIRTERSA